MPSYRLDGFKFDRANIAGVDADCVRGLNSYLTSREAAINTIQTETYICAGGPFDGQPIELEQPAGDMHAHACQPGARTADLAFGKWCGFYQVIKGDKGGLAAVWHEAGAPAVVGTVAFFGKQRAPAKQAKTPTLGSGFAQLGDFIASLSDAQEGDTAEFSIGRTTYRVANNPESIDRLRSRVIRAKKWFADKYIAPARKLEPAHECAELQQAQHAAAAVADVVTQAAARAFVACIVADAVDQAPAECVAMADQEPAAMACADGSGPMVSAAADRGATHAQGQAPTMAQAAAAGLGYGPVSTYGGREPCQTVHQAADTLRRLCMLDAFESSRSALIEAGRAGDQSALPGIRARLQRIADVAGHAVAQTEARRALSELDQAAAANVDNPAPADAPADAPAADTPADPGPAAAIPPAIGPDQAPDYSDTRETLSPLHATPQDLEPADDEQQRDAQKMTVMAMRKASATAAKEITQANHARLLETLPAQYPKLKRAEGRYAGGTFAAKNIRIMLREHFKGTQFSVTSDYNSVRVRWTDGPTDAQVGAVLEPFDIGRSDTSSDYFYTVATAFSDLFGGVQYLSTTRQESDALISRALATFYGAGADVAPTLDEWRKGCGRLTWDERRPFAQYLRALDARNPTI